MLVLAFAVLTALKEAVKTVSSTIIPLAVFSALNVAVVIVETCKAAFIVDVATISVVV